jgi:hypothetical protein
MALVIGIRTTTAPSPFKSKMTPFEVSISQALTALLELQAVEERADRRSVITNSGSRNLAASLE